MADSGKFLITHWWGVRPKYVCHADGSLAVERFEEMKEAGLNLIATFDYGYDINCRVLAACEKLGLRVTLEEGRIGKAIREPAQRRALLEEVVRDYEAYPALYGYHIMDEPSSELFSALGEVRRILGELDPAHEAYINLFPNYASAEMLGNPTYLSHLEQFVQEVKPEILSYDHYHFCKVEKTEAVVTGDEREDRIFAAAVQKRNRPGFFDNIEDARRVCDASGVPMMIIILVVAHGPYRDLSEAEIRWEVWQSLCYGVKRLSYFTYWTPWVDEEGAEDPWNWRNGMITQDGHRTPHYDMVARINRELQALGDILLPHAVEAVFHLGKEPDEKITYFPGAYREVTALSADTATVSFYENGYLLLANKNYESEFSVSLRVKEGLRVRHYDKATGLWRTLTAENGAFTLNLAAGDGELLKID